jgi:hypothetical protein
MLERKTNVYVYIYICATFDSLAEGVQEESAKEDIGPEQEKVIEAFG